MFSVASIFVAVWLVVAVTAIAHIDKELGCCWRPRRPSNIAYDIIFLL